MDLYQLVESRRFLGREFLLWVWFESEVFDQSFSTLAQGDFALMLENQITLDSGKKSKERSRLTGTQPSHTPEAREALRQGKSPALWQGRLQRGEQDFSFVLDAETLSLKAVKLPALLKDVSDESFYERAALLEDLERALDALYADFLRLRTTPQWEQLQKALRSWIDDPSKVDVNAYRKARASAMSSSGRTLHAAAE